jgi:competence protein ComGC
MEKFGITVVLILVVVITIGIVLVLTNRGNEEDIITEEAKRANQQISVDNQVQETLPTGNDEKVEFPGSKPAEKIEAEEHNKEIDRSKPELIF